MAMNKVLTLYRDVLWDMGRVFTHNGWLRDSKPGLEAGYTEWQAENPDSDLTYDDYETEQFNLSVAECEGLVRIAFGAEGNPDYDAWQETLSQVIEALEVIGEQPRRDWAEYDEGLIAYRVSLDRAARILPVLEGFPGVRVDAYEEDEFDQEEE